MQYLIVYGDPTTGLKFVGPFDDADYAMKVADEAFDYTDWWVADLESPADV